MVWTQTHDLSADAPNRIVPGACLQVCVRASHSHHSHGLPVHSSISSHYQTKNAGCGHGQLQLAFTASWAISFAVYFVRDEQGRPT